MTADPVEILPYTPERQTDFYRLNAEWLTRYYTIEPIDHAVLSDPQRHILDGGGVVLFAAVDGAIVGTGALIREAPGVFELTKMAVATAYQGRGIGRRLIAALIAEFHARGGRELFLESQEKLAAALALYRSVGFERQPGVRSGSHYQRADVYMVWRDPGAPR
jgi:ribosomal protein S18 acetylase RimI-like enzyme